MNAGGWVFRCALGRSGISALKREGDGATPLGRLRILCGYRSPGWRRRPVSLGLATLRVDQGWCDATADRNYNRPVRLPYPASHERMRRPDGLYDVCLVLDWNIRPRRRNCGSAIFFHLARPRHLPTEGCVAIPRPVMARLLPRLSRRTVLRVLG